MDTAPPLDSTGYARIGDYIFPIPPSLRSLRESIPNWRLSAPFVEPRWGSMMGCSVTQRALRDTGLWSGTALQFFSSVFIREILFR